MRVILLAVVGIAVAGGFAVLIYNKLVQLRVRSESAWADIDVQLKRRHDLVPNLVETVKGYAGHEQKTFEQVTRLRTQAQAASALADRARAEGELTQGLRGLFAVAENYPQLRAAENFLALQRSLTEVEEALQNARRYYNAVVRDLNTAVQSFPSNLIAGWLGFQARAFFELESASERQAAPLKF